MLKTILLFAFLVFTGCAETRIYQKGQLVAVIQGDCTNVSLIWPGGSFHADALNHSTPTLAAGVAVSKVAGIAGSVATAAISGNATALIPAAASNIPVLKP